MNVEKPAETLGACMGADPVTANGTEGTRTEQENRPVEITELSGHS